MNIGVLACDGGDLSITSKHPLSLKLHVLSLCILDNLGQSYFSNVCNGAGQFLIRRDLTIELFPNPKSCLSHHKNVDPLGSGE